MGRIFRGIIEGFSGFLGMNEETENCLACGESVRTEIKEVSELFADKETLCINCKSQLIPISGDTCIKCGRYLNWRKQNRRNESRDGEVSSISAEHLLCESCKEIEIYYNIVISCYEYTGLCKELLHRLKYSGEPELAEIFGRPMANALGRTLFDASGYFSSKEAEKRLRNSILIPVPVSENKMHTRGYNQALCLAKEIEKISKIKVIDGLHRKKDTEGQHKLTKTERNLNILGAFSYNLEYNIFDRHIILVDDIYTTGSTANECAKVLKAAGSSTVTILTAAGGGKKNL